LTVMLEAGRYFLKKQGMSQGVSDAELIHMAVKSMGLDELGPFDPGKKIIEYVMEDPKTKSLIDLTMAGFSEVLASDSPAPGGGSAAAYVGALGASLGAMVGNLSANKRGWEEQQPFFSDWAVKGQQARQQLLALVDEDTNAFNSLMAAFRMPKDTDADKRSRSEAIEKATLRAIESPLNTIRVAHSLFELLHAMAEKGNPNSVSDAGVGAVCAMAAVEGGWMNVMINLGGLKDKAAAEKIKAEADSLFADSKTRKEKIVGLVVMKMK
ncbi:MAG TPA: cyclodeaminase/cyclohydrolase family protein, partial [Saprospiraceae bacterium]|nr:cyclodeaminase/cyclohydrolase family protein [Saprospiraceae bacterium]